MAIAFVVPTLSDEKSSVQERFPSRQTADEVDRPCRPSELPGQTVSIRPQRSKSDVRLARLGPPPLSGFTVTRKLVKLAAGTFQTSRSKVVAGALKLNSWRRTSR